MKQLLIILLVLFCAASDSFATNYYFSAAGSNTNSGTSSSNPWLSLSKLTGLILKPGDKILLRRGDTFKGGITIFQSGSATSPIIFDAYGTGAKPIISGFSNISSWKNLGGGVYESSIAASTLATCNLVLRNGVVQQIGRYPNANAANKGYLTFQSHIGQTSITSNKISGVPKFVGGEVVIRAIRSILDRCVVTAQTSTTVSYTKVSSRVPWDNHGFFFQNHPLTLDQLGEWYYNKSTKKLRMYWGSSSPTSVQISTVDILINAPGRSYITFNNLHLTGANATSLYLSDAKNVTVNNCDISYTGLGGIEASSPINIKIINSTINWAMDSGIRLLTGSNTLVTSNTIVNCTLKNIGTKAGMGKSGEIKYVGIAVQGSNNYVANCRLDSIGYNAINFYWGNNVIVRHNVISNFCITKNDGGGIYTYNGNANAIPYKGQKITGNFVYNAAYSNEGTTYTSGGSQGIYVDNNSAGITIDSNTVFNTTRGLFLHDIHDIVVRNNTSYNNAECQLLAVYDNAAAPNQPTRNITIKKNILFSKTTSQLVASYKSIINDITSFGKFDSNYYCRPIYEPNGINTTLATAGGVINTVVNMYSKPVTKYFSLDAWKTSTTLYDLHSKKTAKTVTNVTGIKFEYNASSLKKTIALSVAYLGIDNKVYSGNITLAPYSSLILLPYSSANKQEAIVNNFELEDIKVGPNPASGMLSVYLQGIQKNKEMKISILSIDGALIRTTNSNITSSVIHLDISALRAGTYLLRVVSGDKSVNKPFVKQ